jgi:putative tryptophan/tyrosine transport system substrate-binding protein
MRQGFFGLALSALLFALCVPAQAQQPKKIPRIGFMVNTGREDHSIELFRQELRDLGYVEGKNILVEYRYLEGKRDRIPGLLAELVQTNVDVLVVGTPPAIRAAKQATKTVPIVIVTTQDPVAAGIIDSLARPGGNITGLTSLTRDLTGKRLELLKEVVPGMSRVGVLWNADRESPASGFKGYEAAALALKIPLLSLGITGPNPDFARAFQMATKERSNALVTVTNFLFSGYRKQIADLAIKNRLPSMYENSQYVEAGGLMSYSANDADLYRRAAVYVNKILKGTKPADLPVEQPTKFEFIINLKAAKQIGITIPPNVLARADKVIR